MILNKEKIYIFDDLVESDQQTEWINHFYARNGFPWYYNKCNCEDITIDKVSDIDDRIYEGPLFTHMFVTDTNITSDRHLTSFQILEPLLKHINHNALIIRAKANLQTKLLCQDGKLFTTPHIDDEEQPYGDNVWVAIYYVNDSDGKTYIFNETKHSKLDSPFTIKQTVEPKAGRFVLFHMDYWHSGDYPHMSDVRILINYNLKLENVEHE